MKKLSALFLTVAFLVAMSGVSLGQITGTDHDFKNKSWNSSGKICIVCHTPHNSDQTVTNSPLWNHEVTAATFTLYSGTGTLDATVGQPDGVSKLCLSCHDGTVAMDNFGGATGGTDLMAGSEKLGTDLTNDHPVSFTYNTALANTDGELHDPSTTNSGLGSTIDADMLFSSKLECGSCHDVHDNTNGKFLIMANSASAMCLTCHNK